MTEPVAWRKKHSGYKHWIYEETGYIGDWDDVERLYTAEQLHSRVKMTQAEFDLLKEINRGIRGFEQLEEHIEVESNMKWFVRRILPNAGGNMLYYTDEGVLTYNNNKEHATKFDTKEEAERWVNPLTEAVQLPVEGKIK